MGEPDGGGKRRPEPGSREATQSQTGTTATAPAPRPKPVASKPRQAVGVPMAGQSYAKKQAEEARRAKGTAPPPTPTPRPRPKPPVMTEDLEEDFDLDEEYEEDLETQEAKSVETPSKIYSTRRALAEQVNQDVGVKPADPDSDASGIAALKEKRDAWKKMVKKREEQGQSPYVMRWAKVSFFPMLYLLVSISLLRKIRYEYSEYYDYDPFYIFMGLMVGFIFLVIATTGTMLRAKRVRKPILLKGKATWLGLLVFIAISFYLAITLGLAYAWLFSIGFLGAGLIIVGIGYMLEKSGKGTFWVKDPAEGSDKRWLEFVPVVEG